LNSTNGTRLNRERLSTPTVVTSGDQIGCGKTRLTIGLSGDAVTAPM
jgi:pSer/pThr/pTyr-binding forkhead associated (FHA) protein